MKPTSELSFFLPNNLKPTRELRVSFYLTVYSLHFSFVLITFEVLTNSVMNGVRRKGKKRIYAIINYSSVIDTEPECSDQGFCHL